MTSVEVRDPVHDLILLEPNEWEVVDSPPFQRLRRIQQLAMTHMAYPGARHSRFEHCIGVCHIGGRLARAINRVQREAVVDPARIRAAGLCHDLGHGPFSHVSEFVYELRTKRHGIHEQISAGIVRHNPAIQRALGEQTAQWVAELLEGSGHGTVRSIERDIVAGPADVDKLDYLLRDSHFCGVNYGRFDLHKVIESARYASDPAGSVLAFHEDGIYAVEELLLARHHMHRQVYGHKTRVATDRMLVRAMNLGVDEGLLPIDIFAPPPEIEREFIEGYMAWDDYAVIDQLARAGEDKQSGQVMRALIDRRLPRRCAEILSEDLKATAGPRLAGEVLVPRFLPPEAVRRAEEEIAEAIRIDPLWVYLYWEDLQSPLGSAGPPRSDDKSIYLVDDDGAWRGSLEEVSEIFGQPGRKGTRKVVVYVRLDDREWDRDVQDAIKAASVEAVANVAKAVRASSRSI